MTVEQRGISQRSALRLAIEGGASEEILAEILAMSTVTPSGCWQWARRARDGYPVFSYTVGGKNVTIRAHRVALEASLGRPLGRQAAHHICANRMCVNPEHLQPISARENTAEMMQRTYYLQRIRELEDALRVADPSHPLLAEVSISLVGAAMPGEGGQPGAL